jgi:outer membrane protein assembly factor BamB
VTSTRWTIVAPALHRDDVVALGEFEETVDVYGLEPPHLLATLSTVLSFGGDRLALCSVRDSLVVVAGAWERHGVCGYDAESSECLWQRKDLKRVGRVSPAGDGSLVAVALDGRAMQVLDAATGVSVARVREAQGLWQSRHDALAALGWYQQLAVVDTRDWTRVWKASVDGFAVVGVAFAPDGLLASDAADVDQGHLSQVYAFGLDGKEKWRHRLSVEMSCWALAWNEASDEWVGLAHNYNRSTPDVLLRWARDGGELAAIPLASVTAAAFVPGGGRLVTGERVVDARTGAAIPLPPHRSDA